MRHKIFFTLAAAALFLFSQNDSVLAQSETLRYEVGGQFSMVRFGDLDITEPGFGLRTTYNINNHLAVEAEANFFPREAKDFYGETLQGGRKVQGLFGVKLGGRGRKLGLFGKVRPGFVHFKHFTRPGFVCIDACPPQPPPFSETDFALDVGGVVELYPTRRTVLRFDLGDTIIHSGSGVEIALPDVFTFFDGTKLPIDKPVIRSTSHNLQFSVGVGFRF